MGYGDFIPSGANYHKKPLTKEQIKKIKEAYEKADIITEHIKELESKEKEKNKERLENSLNSLFL